MKKVFKKKGFCIDKITEDSFYENLILGLTSVLKTCPFISQTKLERLSPATSEDVSLWEFTNGLTLPGDLRDFYLSTNGFYFTYKFQYDKTESDELSYVTAGIEINPLIKLEKMMVNSTTYLTEGGAKMLTTQSNIYILCRVEDSTFVILAQFNPLKPPNFWLYYKMKTFYFLCEDFSTYFRMALAHLGIPSWQLSVLKGSLPEWSVEMIQILAPGIFERKRGEAKIELNLLDIDIFSSCEDEDSEEKKKVKSKPKK